MQKIHCPLIVSDFDGTLVRKDGTVSVNDKRAIEEYIAAGGKFAISTGRLPYGILPRAKELGLRGMLSCCQGSIIMDIQSEEIFLAGHLPLDSTIAACKKLEEMDLHFHAYTLTEYYTNRDDEFMQAYESIVCTKAVRVLDKPLSVFLKELNQPIYKLLAVVPAKQSDAILQDLQVMAFDGCDFTKSTDFFVEVIPKGYSKGTAVEFLANHYALPLANTVAVGDQRNDMPMVQRAGIGVAVQNADRQLKEVADYVCRATNEEDAIAEVIATFGFYKENA